MLNIIFFPLLDFFFVLSLIDRTGGEEEERRGGGLIDTIQLIIKSN